MIGQPLEVAHVAEQALNVLQLPQVRAVAGAIGFDRHFEPVSQFLQRNAHLVQALGKIDAAGFGDRFLECTCTVRDPRVDGPPPLPIDGPIRRAVLFVSGLELFGDRVELPHQSREIARCRPGRKTPLYLCATGAQNIAEAPLRRGHRVRDPAVQDGKDRVELARAAKAARDLAETLAQLLCPAPLELQQRQQLAQAPRRDARTVDGTRIAGRDTG